MMSYLFTEHKLSAQLLARHRFTRTRASLSDVGIAGLPPAARTQLSFCSWPRLGRFSQRITYDQLTRPSQPTEGESDLIMERRTPTTSFEALASGTASRRPARLGTAVLATLVETIVSGELPPESPLPTESTLCDAFGVSRTVIRESLKLLEAKGLVRVRQGQGTTVEPTEQWDLLDPLVLDTAIRCDGTFEILDDVIDVRVGLESQMTRRAAILMTDAQLRELHDALVALEKLLDQPERYQKA